MVGVTAVTGYAPAAGAIIVFFDLHEFVLHATSIAQASNLSTVKVAAQAVL